MHVFRKGRASVLRCAIAAAFALSTISSLPAPVLAVGGVTGTINGTVTDATTRTPIANVDVAVASPSQSAHTTTDGKGFFALTGLPVDTYTVSFMLNGYEVSVVNGVTIQGDQQVAVNGSLVKSLTRIGRTQTRAQSAAYQPKQTTDSYQVTGQQVQTALGRQGNISQTQLQSSVPSITTTFYGSSSIRGSTRTEIAYQFDGIDYTDPLTAQFQNSLGLNGLQSLQVNPGAGDATQGNAGAGAVNIVVKRGSRPNFGSFYIEAANYPRANYVSGEYGWATPDGKFSNYSSFVGQVNYSQYGLKDTPPYVTGSFLSTDYSVTRDFINNFVYKFGHDKSRSLQFLYQTRYSDFFVNHGGIDNLCFKTCDPNIAGTATLAGQLDSTTYFPGLTLAQRYNDFQRIVGLLPTQSDVNQPLSYQGFNHQPVDVMKLEYSQQLNATTFWTNRLYRVVGNSQFNRPYDTQTTSSRINWAQGGARSALAGSFVKLLGDKHQVELSYTYQAVQPVYDNVSNTLGYRALVDGIQGDPTRGFELVDFIPQTGGYACPTTDSFGTPLAPVSGVKGTPACGYLAQYFPNGIPRVPLNRFSSAGFQHLYGVGIRDQFNVSSKLRLDYGVRLDGSNFQILNGQGYGITEATKKPSVTEPRFAGAYQFGARDAVRFSYGRSVQFTPGGILNSPVSYYDEYRNIPSRDSRTGLPATNCGPPTFTSVCTSYAQQIHDEQVAFDGLEAFNVKPSTYNNFDFSYSHQFAGNVGLKITPFFKRGYDVNVFTTPVIGTDPVSGLAIFGPSTLSSAGIDKTTGVEFLLTKDAAVGLSGFLALTYVNRLQNVPPGYGGQLEDFYPSIPPASLALGNLYRAGYLSPLNGRLGVNYKTRGGFRVNPIVSYDKGFPIIGAGNLTSAFVNAKPYVVPNTNAAIPGYGIIANGGAPSVVTQYVSPTNPGSVFNPNIAATRGTPETALAGGVLSRARLNTDIDFEYSKPGWRGTLGLYVSNLFNQIYSEPSLNSRYQPVATGIAGPQTGQTSGYFLYGPQLGYYNYGPERFGRQPYIIVPNNAPTRLRLYYQVQL